MMMPSLLQLKVSKKRIYTVRGPAVIRRRLSVERLEARKLLTGFSSVAPAAELFTSASLVTSTGLLEKSVGHGNGVQDDRILFSDPQAGASVFHRMFVTGNQYGVGSGGFLGPNARNFADYECTFAAWDAGWLPSWDGEQIVYTAFMSHSGLAMQNATDRIVLEGPVYNTRNEIVWVNPSDYLNSTPAHTWGLTEYGSQVTSNKLWSGSDLGGGIANDCSNWTNPLASGVHGSLDILTFGGTPSGCQGGGHFICFGPAEIGEFATVTDSFIYHSNSVFDTGDISLALDTNKSLARENNVNESLGFDNLISSSRGVNGLVFDFDNLRGTVTTDDIVFQWSPQGAFVVEDNLPVDWLPAPTPIEISTLFEATRDRVVIKWQDNAIANRWLRITILANANTGLLQNDVYYLGHLLGETTGQSGGTFTVAFADITSIRSEVGQNVNTGSIHDIDKSGTVSFADISAMRANIGAQLPQFVIPGSGGAGSGSAINDVGGGGVGGGGAGSTSGGDSGLLASPLPDSGRHMIGIEFKGGGRHELGTEREVSVLWLKEFKRLSVWTAARDQWFGNMEHQAEPRHPAVAETKCSNELELSLEEGSRDKHKGLVYNSANPTKYSNSQ